MWFARLLLALAPQLICDVLGGRGSSSSHRRLDQWEHDAVTAIELSKYSIKYQGCHVRQTGLAFEEHDGRDHDPDADRPEDGGRKRRRGGEHRRLEDSAAEEGGGTSFVTLRLCAGGRTAPPCAVCRSDRDDIAVDLRTYLEHAVEYKWEMQEMRCEACHECAERDATPPPAEDAGDGGAPSDRPGDDDCDSIDATACYADCQFFENMEEEGYVNGAEFVGCEALRRGGGERRYIGPYCDGDDGILIGIFLDPRCSVRDATADVESFLQAEHYGAQMKISYHLLEQAHDADDCVAQCAEDRWGLRRRRLQDYSIFSPTNGGGEGEGGVVHLAEGGDEAVPGINPFCEGLYEATSGFEATYEEFYEHHDEYHSGHVGEEGWDQICEPGVEEPHFCTNGGICVLSEVEGVGCSCPPTFYGEHCELRIGDEDMDHEDHYDFEEEDNEYNAVADDDIGWDDDSGNVPLWDPVNYTKMEVHALKMMYRLTNGYEWANSNFWLSDSPICTWHGVGCDIGGWVSSLSLGRNSLVGSFTDLGNVVFELLPNLTRLDLEGNKMSGTIPHNIGDLRNLTYLNLAHNGLKGTISTSLFRLARLESMLLQENEFSYLWIPDNGYPTLKNLDLGGNDLTGTMQYDILKLSQLRNVSLRGNRLRGPLPNDYSSLRNLVKFDASSNLITGTISEQAFRGNAGLRLLNLSKNELAGTIPQGLMEAAFAEAGWPPVPQVIDLSFNELEGKVPDFEVDALEIGVVGNRLDSVDPAACLRDLWNAGPGQEEFGCDGIACPIGTSNAAGRQTLGGGPCEPCEFARFIGTVGCEGGRDDDSLGVPPPPAECPCLHGGKCDTDNDSSYNNNNNNDDQYSYNNNHNVYAGSSNSDASVSFSCICPPGYFGVLCENLPASLQNTPLSSSLQVTSPVVLFKKGGYDHKLAPYGLQNFQGGASFIEKVLYANSDGCDRNLMDPDVMGTFILMVDRGSCTFTRKTRNAQSIGARAVIIADNTCLCSAENACAPEPGQSCEERPPVLVDDGSGVNIVIPTFLLYKQDADPIKAELKAADPVLIEMAFEPIQTDIVEYEVWMSPTDAASTKFLLGFKDTAEALRGHARFTPRLYIYDGIESGCMSVDGENACYNLCTNNGRYCATDPNDNLDAGIAGADVVLESLRWVCIWETLGRGNDSVGLSWWEYVSFFVDACADPGLFVNGECSKRALAVADIDPEMINQCILVHGGVEGDTKNKLLEEQIYFRGKQGVSILPTLVVQNQPIRGSLTPANALRAICAGFMIGSVPPVCRENAVINAQPTPPLYPTYAPKSSSSFSYEGGTGVSGSDGVSGLHSEVSSTQQTEDTSSAAAPSNGILVNSILSASSLVPSSEPSSVPLTEQTATPTFEEISFGESGSSKCVGLPFLFLFAHFILFIFGGWP